MTDRDRWWAEVQMPRIPRLRPVGFQWLTPRNWLAHVWIWLDDLLYPFDMTLGRHWGKWWLFMGGHWIGVIQDRELWKAQRRKAAK